MQTVHGLPKVTRHILEFNDQATPSFEESLNSIIRKVNIAPESINRFKENNPKTTNRLALFSIILKPAVENGELTEEQAVAIAECLEKTEIDEDFVLPDSMALCFYRLKEERRVDIGLLNLLLKENTERVENPNLNRTLYKNEAFVGPRSFVHTPLFTPGKTQKFTSLKGIKRVFTLEGVTNSTKNVAHFFESNAIGATKWLNSFENNTSKAVLLLPSLVVRAAGTAIAAVAAAVTGLVAGVLTLIKNALCLLWNYKGAILATIAAVVVVAGVITAPYFAPTMLGFAALSTKACLIINAVTTVGGSLLGAIGYLVKEVWNLRTELQALKVAQGEKEIESEEEIDAFSTSSGSSKTPNVSRRESVSSLVGALEESDGEEAGDNNRAAV